MRTKTRPASGHPEAATVVELWHQPHDRADEVQIGEWARTDNFDVAPGADLLAEACDALGLGGQHLMGTLLRTLDHDDREWLARAVLEVARMAQEAAWAIAALPDTEVDA